ncbi:condensation domain protein [Collimonas fungivorans]|uniref:Condensation domain protein n=1 Tax=Collimonas fungivorans TaxID=158899 RepID=A0A127P5X6_9BURK|nr:condensation domain-containing protein [Collimonas fungivorans]AMO93240.1 condensation domain protein [Collimonas fungivorans]
MINIAELLSDMDARGAQFWIEKDRLHYSAPKDQLTTADIHSLREHKNQIIEFLKGTAATAVSQRAADGGPPPLSYAQTRLWALEQIEPLGEVYNSCFGISLKGKLDSKSLASAVQGIVDRHEVLRTVFTMVDESPVQTIMPSVVVPIAREEVVGSDQNDRQTRMIDIVKRERAKPFDLSLGPMLRVTLIRVDEHDHVLILVLHHIICDGWSMTVFARELSSLYAGANLPALAVQYADYAIWQREQLRGVSLAKQEQWWKTALLGAPEGVDLPLDRSRPQRQSFNGAQMDIIIPGPLSEKLIELGRARGATLFMVLLAGFKLVLARWSNQTDIVVGTPIAGRPRRELEDLIGFFANTLVLRTDLSGDPTFDDLLKRVRENCLDAYSNQDLPFERVVELINPKRDLSRHLLFQIMFALGNMPTGKLALPELEVSQLAMPNASSKFDLTLNLVETSNGVSGIIEYSTDLFDASTIERMAGHLVQVLEEVAREPSMPLARISMLGQGERELVLKQWNDTAREVQEQTLVELFEAQVEATPQAVALVCGEQELSYGELNARANRLAHVLIARGWGQRTLWGCAWSAAWRWW